MKPPPVPKSFRNDRKTVEEKRRCKSNKYKESRATEDLPDQTKNGTATFRIDKKSTSFNEMGNAKRPVEEYLDKVHKISRTGSLFQKLRQRFRRSEGQQQE